jgi:hydrogenase expression/formation protein HypE
MKNSEKITLSHGSGGKLTHRLIREIFIEHLGNPVLNKLQDSAVLELSRKKIAFTTDSFVVQPIFFPGGDIGKLAVCGTVNDLAVMGARPAFISCGVIIEEGLKISDLQRVAASLGRIAKLSAVVVVCGDIKVIEKGTYGGMMVNTSGIGIFNPDPGLNRQKIKPGDKIIINGSVGDHGIAVLSAREELSFSCKLKSDVAPLHNLVKDIVNASGKIKFMRDATRGGIATVVNEIVEDMKFGIRLVESEIPIRDTVNAACEMLGLDPLYIGNEGKVIVVVEEADSKAVVKAMKANPLGRETAIIGEVTDNLKAKVTLETSSGGRRILDMLSGEQIPRIC